MVIAAKAWLLTGSTLQCGRVISLRFTAIGLRRRRPDISGSNRERERALALEHDPEKWEPVFRKDHAHKEMRS
jgi:hypothetical protein